MNAPKAFRITDGKGFHITFANGYTISVQFGPGNYGDNYGQKIGVDDVVCGKEGSNEAEIAIFSPTGDLIHLPTEISGEDYSDNVAGYVDAEKVLAYANFAQSLKGDEAHG